MQKLILSSIAPFISIFMNKNDREKNKGKYFFKYNVVEVFWNGVSLTSQYFILIFYI